MDYSDFAPPIYIDRHFSRLVYSFIDFLFVYMTVKDIGIAASTVFLFYIGQEKESYHNFYTTLRLRGVMCEIIHFSREKKTLTDTYTHIRVTRLGFIEHALGNDVIGLITYRITYKQHPMEMISFNLAMQYA